MLFVHTMTIFNLISEDDEPVYQKSTVSKVLWVKDENTARNKLGVVDADAITVYIPKSATEEHERLLVSGAEFERALDKSNLYAYRKGDFVCFGDVSLGGLSINELKNLTDNVFEITGLSDFSFGGLPNFVLSAK